MARALADQPRVGRAVDAVGLFGQRDPRRPDRIVRPRLDRQLALARVAEGQPLRVKGIGRISRHRADLPSSVGGRALLAADRRGIGGEQLAVGTERADRVRRLVDLDPGHGGGQLRLADGGDGDLAPRLGEIGSRVERLEQRLVHVKALGERLDRPRERQFVELGEFGHVGWQLVDERSGDVGVGDRITGDSRLLIAGDKLVC